MNEYSKTVLAGEIYAQLLGALEPKGLLNAYELGAMAEMSLKAADVFEQKRQEHLKTTPVPVAEPA